jgi:hypothetical protein
MPEAKKKILFSMLFRLRRVRDYNLNGCFLSPPAGGLKKHPFKLNIHSGEAATGIF